MMYAENICRVCLGVSDDLTPLRVRLPGADKTLEETIHFVLNINMTFEDGLPDKICNECETMLNGADTLRQRLLKSEEILNQLAKEKATNESGPSFANKALDSSEVYPNDGSRLPTEVIKNGEDLFDLPEYNVKVEIVEDDVCEENPAQENLDVEDSPAIPKEQLLPKEEVPGITESNMNKRSKHVARNTDNALKLSGTDDGFTFKEQTTSFNNTNNTSDVLTCKFCEFTTVRFKWLQSHLKAHAATKRYSCDSCLYLTTDIKSFARHKVTHTGDKPYSGDVCEKNLSSKCNLITHVRTHTGDKSYWCDVCEKKFGKKSSFDVHVRTHTGDKPYSCEVCKKKFGQKANLDVHVRTHTGDKPYSCDVCEKNFAQKANLDSHVRTHTGDRPYSCDVCEKKYGKKHHLDTHIRTHTGDKPYSCNECGKKFSCKQNLMRHKKLHK